MLPVAYLIRLVSSEPVFHISLLIQKLDDLLSGQLHHPNTSITVLPSDFASLDSHSQCPISARKIVLVRPSSVTTTSRLTPMTVNIPPCYEQYTVHSLIQKMEIYLQGCILKFKRPDLSWNLPFHLSKPSTLSITTTNAKHLHLQSPTAFCTIKSFYRARIRLLFWSAISGAVTFCLHE